MTTAQAARETGVALSAEARAAQLYEQHRQTIFRLCMRQLGRHEDAADAVQTTFVYALRSLRRGVVPQFELAWLWKIATNVCSTQRRSSTQRTHQDIDALHDVLSAPERADPIAADDLRAALRTLTPNQRQAILLREWKGLSYDEIGDELGLSQAATETLLYRARRTLARKLEATYALDGFSLASLARSMLTSGAAKATAAAIGTTASIAATSVAIHDLHKPGPHARGASITQRSAATPVRRRVRTYAHGPKSEAPPRNSAPAHRPVTHSTVTPPSGVTSQSIEIAPSPAPPTTGQSPPAATASTAPAVTLPAAAPPTDPPAAIPPVPKLPDVVPTAAVPQLALPKLAP